MIASSVMSRVRGGGKRVFLRLHEIASSVGFIILPKHYYVPIPDLAALRRSRSVWARRSGLHGLTIDLEAQLQALRRLVQPYEPEYSGNTAFRDATKGAFGPGFGYVEAQVLHGFVRGGRPQRILEVGSGVSTYCMMQAATRNAAEGHPASITCIEPYPSDWLAVAPVRLIRERVETVPQEIFDELGSGDLLFIDSTHTVRTGGDVTHIVLEILPRLKPGVVVHFHDIFLPFDFQRDADRSLFQWMETALLHAYLIGNAGVEILFCLSHLHYDRPDALREIVPEYIQEPGCDGLRQERAIGHFPSSLYLRMTDNRSQRS